MKYLHYLKIKTIYYVENEDEKEEIFKLHNNKINLNFENWKSNTSKRQDIKRH